MSSLGIGQVKQVLMGLDGMSMAQCNLRDLQQTSGAHLCVCMCVWCARQQGQALIREAKDLQSQQHNV